MSRSGEPRFEPVRPICGRTDGEYVRCTPNSLALRGDGIRGDDLGGEGIMNVCEEDGRVGGLGLHYKTRERANDNLEHTDDAKLQHF